MTGAARGDDSTGSAQQIARVAARLFASKGYDATSVREITEEAGVTKPTLYYHFGSKEGLAQALLTVPMNLLVQRIDQIVRRAGDPIDQLAEFMEVHFDYCREEPDGLRFLYALIFGPMSRALADEVCDHTCEMDRLAEQLVLRAVDAGLLLDEDRQRFYIAFKGQVMIRTMAHLYRGMNLEPGLGRRLVRDILFGFATERARHLEDGKERS